MFGSLVKSFINAIRTAFSGAFTFVVWTVWLVLGILLGLQIYVASTNQLQVPTFLQKAILERLAVSGVHIAFGNTTFDPSGSILIEHATITLDGFEEPIATVQSLYARIDPAALALQKIEPLELRVSGVSLRVPAMLSPSGKADEIVKDLDADFIPKSKSLKIAYLRGHVGSLLLSLSGEVPFGEQIKSQQQALPIAELLSRYYPSISKRCATALGALSALDSPYLRVTLIPTADGEIADCMLGAAGLRLTDPTVMQFGQINASARIPVTGKSIGVDELIINANRFNAPAHEVTGRGVRIIVKGVNSKETPKASASPVLIDEISLIATRVMVRGVQVDAPMITLNSGDGDVLTALGLFDNPGNINVKAKAWVLSERDIFDGKLDLKTRSLSGDFKSQLPPSVLGLVQSQLKKNLEKYIQFNNPVEIVGHVSTDSAWHFKEARAHIDATDFSILNIKVDELRGNFKFDGKHLSSEDAYARIGANYARGGIYEDFSNYTFRYLIKGQLRPLEISRWIPQAWWNDLFKPFVFMSTPPEADLDFSGSMLDGIHAKTFLFAESKNPIIRGVDFDSVKTLLFSRPQYVDVIHFALFKKGNSAQGRFTRALDIRVGPTSQFFDFDAESNLTYEDLLSLGGYQVPAVLSAISFSGSPAIGIHGKVSGPNSKQGAHRDVSIQVQSSKELKLSGFPLDSVTTTVFVKDETVSLPEVNAAFAGGQVRSKILITNLGNNPKLAYDGTLTDARLDKAILLMSSFSADKHHSEPQGLAAFLKDKSNVLFSVSSKAEGLLGVTNSFQGNGSAQFRGAELGQVKMLGLLSELIRFTALRFTSARAEFTVEGSKLNFSDISVVGANSAINAQGSYTFGTKQLDFKARINPFKESKNLPQQVMDVVLTPLSDVLQLELRGTVDKPSWAFANSPVTILRNLGERDPQVTTDKQSVEPAKPIKKP